MTVTLEDFMSDFTPAEREQVTTRFQELVEEELSLRGLRETHGFTQKEVANGMGVEQENVSRLERRDDFLVSSAYKYVKALGGRLRLIAEFPNQQPVTVVLPIDVKNGNSTRQRLTSLPIDVENRNSKKARRVPHPSRIRK